MPERKYIPSIRVGQAVGSKTRALPDRVLRARGHRDQRRDRRDHPPAIVRSEIPNPEGALKSEMCASFKIRDPPPDQPSPSVPVPAVIREGDHAVVWVEEERWCSGGAR